MHLSAFSTDIAEQVDSAKQAEREWHDAFYAAHGSRDYPETLAEFQERFRRVELTPFCEGGWNWWADPRREALEALGEVRGLSVLDYGCGAGTLGMYLSLCGANVRGFDLSLEGIRVANEVARRYGLSAQFEQMDAEQLRYPENSFDLVVGFGVLHHVIKYPRANFHVLRVMKPAAKAIFVETLWDNPIINLVRRFTTEDEEAGDAKLTEQNIRQFSEGFRRVHLEKRHLVYMLKRLAKLPPRNLSIAMRPRSFWRRVKSFDDTLLRVPFLRRYCGEVIISLEK
jgi:2-polyprenyl-3-methyl-5-hydroxy-6-metoxy-1,4-benzoquinol methylase